VSGEKTGSIGVPIPNTYAKIVDLASGEELPPGEIRELVVRGPQRGGSDTSVYVLQTAP